MNFGSFVFLLILLPVSILIYFLADKIKNPIFKNIVVLLFSIAFYCWIGVKYFVFILSLTIINYLLVLLMKNEKAKKSLMIIAVTINVLFLIFFKYLDFLASIISIDNSFFHSIVAPLGVSFIVFHLIAYVVDVYRGDAENDKNPLNLLIYVFFFPKIVVGPITPYKDMIGQIKERTTSIDDMSSGLKLFILGLTQKVFIADMLLPIAREAFANPTQISTWIAWVGLITYTIQIYVDFVSYTNMAIGLAKIFGFALPKNFDYPYISRGVTDFWRRWHITLGAWFRNYVYIPLGGNRKGNIRTYVNLLIIFILTGIWHGAAWQFIVWGLYHGVFMLLERAFLGKYLKKTPYIVSALYTLIIVMLGWVLFNSNDIVSAWQYLVSLFNFNSSTAAYQTILPLFEPLFFVALGFGVLCCFPFAKLIPESIKNNSILANSLAVVGLILCLIYLSGTSFNPFIYFNF